MVNYKDLGLVNTRAMFAKAVKGGYAIPAYNFNNMEQLQAIIQACVETESPLILQVSKGAREYANQTLLRYMAQGATEYAKEIQKDGKLIPICLHLDHGLDFATCKSCVDYGFSSVMIDGSKLPFDENCEQTAKVVEYADSLAIAIGTSHGAYKFKPGTDPKIRLDILHEIEKRIPGFPIVLHGSSSVPQDLVKIINENGGKLKDAIGIGEDQLREAAKSAVCKINIDSDGRLAMTAAVRKVFHDKPEEFDPRKYLGPAREALKQLYMRKNREVLGSAGHAFDC